MYILLVDYGASRTKAALWDTSEKICLDAHDVPSPAPCDTQNGNYALPPEAYWDNLKKTAEYLILKNAVTVERLYICSEMHGFLLADEHMSPITGYISWKDQRAGNVLQGRSVSTLDLLSDTLGERFFNMTGMRLKPGLPFVNVASMVFNSELPSGKLQLLTLPDWLLVRGGALSAAIDATLAAGTGFYDLFDNCWSSELVSAVVPSTTELCLPSVVSAGQPTGEISLAGQRIQVYGATGDFQTALMGAGFSEETPVVINIGTGSQVACMTAQESAYGMDGYVEMRRTCTGRLFKTITHIPAGRALSAIAKILDGFAEAAGGRAFFWSAWRDLSVSEVLSAPLIANLSIFESAWHYSKTSGYITIREEFAEPRVLLAGIANSWLYQYKDALDCLAPKDEHLNIVFSGGLTRKTPFLREAFEQISGRSVELSNPILGEESLDGLLSQYHMDNFDI